MLRDVVSVEPLGGHRLQLRFDDGVEGVVDVAELIAFTGVFEPLQSEEYFTQAFVDAELRTVCWPNHADLDSDVLYAKVIGAPIPDRHAEG